MTTGTRSPEETLRTVAASSPYSLEAYRFLYEALAFTSKRLERDGHVSGRELVEGLRDLALTQFGGLARMVLETWGVRRTADWGDIVFRLVRADLLGKTDRDSIEDFRDVYDFATTFRLDAEPPAEKP